MFCPYCGSEIFDEAVICVKCGCRVEPRRSVVPANAGSDDTLSVIIKVFLIIGCIVEGWMIIPLAWCIPITVKIFNCLKNGQPISTGLKVCTLIFVSMISGICLLCMDDE